MMETPLVILSIVISIALLFIGLALFSIGVGLGLEWGFNVTNKIMKRLKRGVDDG